MSASTVSQRVKQAISEGKVVVVRSGAAHKDIVIDPNTTVLIDLQAENAVVQTASTNASLSINVGPGACMEKLFTSALDKGYILPLALKKDRSFGSAFTKCITQATSADAVPCVLLGSLGQLTKYVTSLNVVSLTTGDEYAIAPASYVAGDQIITSANITAPTTDSFLSGECITLPYTREVAIAAAQHIAQMGTASSAVAMDVYTGSFGFPLIRIRSTAAAQVFKSMLLASYVAAGAEPTDAFSQTFAFVQTVADTNEGVQPEYAQPSAMLRGASIDVETALAQFEEGTIGGVGVLSSGASARGLRATDGTVVVAAVNPYNAKTYTFDADGNCIFDKVDPIVGNHNEWLAKATGGNHIPKFAGKSFTKNDAFYNNARQQYGLSSFSEAATSPFLICYPTNVDDIKAAVVYARSLGKCVVARSGGHQYSAKSTGGDDTVVISLDTAPFQTLQKLVGYGNNNVVALTPAMKLIDISGAFRALGVTIPHGECPFVCIGGHAQTGGYGHIIRTFGLAMDYVTQFDIVLANGTLANVSRPAANTDKKAPKGYDNTLMTTNNLGQTIDRSKYTLLTNKENRDLFRSVLAGNAGSFGVVTRYVFEALRDADYPTAKLYVKAQTFNGDVFKQSLRYVKTITERIAAGTDEDADATTKGLDFMMTVCSTKTSTMNFTQNSPPMHIVEGVSVNGAIADPFAEFKDITSFKIKEVNTPAPLSFANRAFVRLPGEGTTLDGREYPYPYKKRLNITFSAITEEFVVAFGDLVTRAMNTDKIFFVFQMVLGGGAYRAKGRELCYGETITGIPSREYVYSFVFDMFYPNPEGEAFADSLQNEVSAMIKLHFNTADHDARMFWGSFDANNTKAEGTKGPSELDMSRAAVQQMYYDSAKQYKKLQQVKKRFDGGNLFRTSLTVQPKKSDKSDSSDSSSSSDSDDDAYRLQMPMLGKGLPDASAVVAQSRLVSLFTMRGLFRAVLLLGVLAVIAAVAVTVKGERRSAVVSQEQQEEIVAADSTTTTSAAAAAEEEQQ